MNNTYCFLCGKRDLARDEIGLNKKLINREIRRFFCIECMAEYFEVDVDFLREKIEEFKQQGCTLF